MIISQLLTSSRRKTVRAIAAAFDVFSAVAAFAQQGAPARGGPTPAATGAPSGSGRGGRAGNALPTLPSGKLYNTAKEKLLAGQQVFSFTQSTMDPACYCEKAIQGYRGDDRGVSACGCDTHDPPAGRSGDAHPAHDGISDVWA